MAKSSQKQKIRNLYKTALKKIRNAQVNTKRYLIFIKKIQVIVNRNFTECDCFQLLQNKWSETQNYGKAEIKFFNGNRNISSSN